MNVIKISTKISLFFINRSQCNPLLAEICALTVVYCKPFTQIDFIMHCTMLGKKTRSCLLLKTRIVEKYDSNCHFKSLNIFLNGRFNTFVLFTDNWIHFNKWQVFAIVMVSLQLENSHLRVWGSDLIRFYYS